MKKKIIMLVSAFIGSMNLMASYAMPTDFALKPNATYTETQTTIIVSAKYPDFTLKLKSNPSTGYSWMLGDYNKRLLKIVKHIRVKAPTKLVGAPTYELWTFKVRKSAFSMPQQLKLTMLYARPWEGSEGATKITYLISTR